MFCRACSKVIEQAAWQEHIRNHKLEYCERFGLNKKYYYDIDWENVVRIYNPNQMRKEVEIKTSQKSLEDFNEKNKNLCKS